MGLWKIERGEEQADNGAVFTTWLRLTRHQSLADRTIPAANRLVLFPLRADL